MEKNKEEFMKDKKQKMTEREQEIWNQGSRLLSMELKLKNKYHLELMEAKDLLSKCKTLIADMVMYNLDDRPESYNDVMKQAQELLTELKDY